MKDEEGKQIWTITEGVSGESDPVAPIRSIQNNYIDINGLFADVFLYLCR